MAPELFVSTFFSPEKCDIYSFGMILWEMSTQMYPYEDYDNTHTIIYNVITNNLRPCLYKLSNEQNPKKIFKSTIERCWSQVPASRPTADFILFHFQNKLL